MGLFDTVSIGAGMAAITCYECGVRFDVPDTWQQNRRNDHAWFYCPNGHTQRYTGKSEAEKLRDQLAAKDREAMRLRDRIADEQRGREHAENRVRAHKGIVTKIKKRIANGTCPCCHRKFKDLRDHMKAEHPDWDPGKGADAIASVTA